MALPASSGKTLPNGPDFPTVITCMGSAQVSVHLDSVISVMGGETLVSCMSVCSSILSYVRGIVASVRKIWGGLPPIVTGARSARHPSDIGIFGKDDEQMILNEKGR